ncbi:SEL1-like repeat protein, partial [Archangium gephyra]
MPGSSGLAGLRAVLCVVWVGAWGCATGNHAAASPSTLSTACEQGTAHSCFLLGLRYEDGTGVAKDERRAAALYEQACTGGV